MGPPPTAVSRCILRRRMQAFYNRTPRSYSEQIVYILARRGKRRLLMIDAASPPPSQTLSRGIRILEILADVREPLSIDEIARRLEVHRSVAYRLLRTLEDHGLII